MQIPMPRFERGCTSKMFDFLPRTGSFDDFQIFSKNVGDTIEGSFNWAFEKLRKQVAMMVVCNASHVYLVDDSGTRIFARHKKSVKSVRIFSRSLMGTFLVASGDESGRVLVWDASDIDKTPFIDVCCVESVEALEWHESGSFIIVSGRGKQSVLGVVDVSSLSPQIKLVSSDLNCDNLVHTPNASFAPTNQSIETIDSDFVSNPDDLFQSQAKLLTEISLCGPTRDCLSVCVSRSGFAVGCDDGVIYIYGRRPINLLATSRLGKAVTAVTFLSPALIACACFDGSINVVSASDGSTCGETVLINSKPTAIACIDETKLNFVVSFLDGHFRTFTYSRESGLCLLSEFSGSNVDNKKPQILDVVRRGKVLAFSLSDGHLMFTDDQLKPFNEIFGHSSPISCVMYRDEFTRNLSECLLLSASKDGFIYNYAICNPYETSNDDGSGNIDTRVPFGSYGLFNRNNPTYHPDERVDALIPTYSDGKLCSVHAVGPRTVLDLDNGQLFKLPSASRIMMGESDGNVYAVNLDKLSVTASISKLHFSRDGVSSEALCDLKGVKDAEEINLIEKVGSHTAISIGKGNSLIMMKDGLMSGPIIVSSGRLKCLAYSSDGAYFVTGDDQRRVNLFSCQKGLLGPEKISTRWCHHVSTVGCITFIPNGTMIISGGFDGAIIVWNVQEVGKPLHVETKAHIGAVGKIMAISARSFLSWGSFDGTIKLWGLNEIGELSNL